MLWINVLGGMAVIGSYAYGLLTHPGNSQALWGGVPKDLRSLYAAGMLAAALGYLAFTYHLLLRVDPSITQIGKLGFGAFNTLYAAILVPSALWMPLTWRMIDQPGTVLWFAIRVVLGLVGLSSLGMVLALWILRPREPEGTYWLAVIGSAVFCLHTGVLDALIWPWLFPV
jgi:hypothetical protein